MIHKWREKKNKKNNYTEVYLLLRVNIWHRGNLFNRQNNILRTIQIRPDFKQDILEYIIKM